MRLACLFCALVALRPGFAAPGPDEYRARRTELSQKLHDGVLVLFGHTEKGEETIRTGFFQEPINNMVWPSIIALVLLVVFTIIGSGPFSLDKHLDKWEA